MSKKISKKNGIICAVITIFALCLLVSHFNQTYIYSNNIAKNIFIENVDVSQMNKKQAIEAVKNSYSPKSIHLSYEGKKHEISPEDIDLKYDVEKAVEDAYNYTKTDKYFENIKRYFSLKNNKKDIKIKASYNEAKLSESIQNISKNVDVEMVNAKVYVSGGSVGHKPSVTGKQLDIGNTLEQVIKAVDDKDYSEIALKVNVKEPEIKTKDAQSVDTLLGQFTTKFSTNSSARTHNIRTAANKSSNVLLMPGEEFSYNNLTGMRNRANGYKDAPVIIRGKLEDGLGGGVCQVSTTLYNAVLSSGMDLTSITNHSVASSYVPLGRDAMVNDGGTDFKFKNPYSHPVYVKNWVGNGTVTCAIYGNSQDNPNIDIVVNTFKQGGLDAANTYRIFKNSNGEVIKKEHVDKSVYRKLKK